MFEDVFEDVFEDLRKEFAVIAGARTAVKPPNWRETKIGNWAGGFVKEAERIAGPNWWEKPSNQFEQSLNDLLRSAGLGRLQDATDPREEVENYRTPPVTSTRIAERQRDKSQRRRERSATDEEKYAEYFPEADDNAWAWADALATKVDTNTPESRPWYSALLSYIRKFPQKTKASDLDQETVAKLVKQICDGGHS